MFETLPIESKFEELADKVEKLFQPIKDIIEDFAVGDFFKAGQDASSLVVSITDFFAAAINKVNWYGIGQKIGDFLAGVDWLNILDSTGKVIWESLKAVIEIWSGMFEKAPIETLLITFGSIGFKLGYLKLTKELLLKNLINVLGLKATVVGGISFSVSATLIIAWTLKNLIKDEESFIRKFLDENAYSEEDRKTYKEFDNFTWTENIKKNFEEIKEGWQSLFDFENQNQPNIFELYEEKLLSFRNKFKNTMEDTFGEWAGVTLPDVAHSISVWFDDDVSPWFTKDKWDELGQNMKSGLSNKWEEFTNWWKTTGLYNWWKKDVEPFFNKDVWSWNGIKEGLTASWNVAIVSIKNIWNTFATWLNDKLTWDIDPISIAGKEIFGGNHY